MYHRPFEKLILPPLPKLPATNETRGSLPYSQQPATWPYPEPAESSTRTLPSYFRKIKCNITFPSTFRSSNRLFSFRFFRPKSACASLLPHTCYMPHSSHPPWFIYPDDVVWERKQPNSAKCNFLHPPNTSSLIISIDTDLGGPLVSLPLPPC